jgi:hypothetical protein
VTAQEDEGRPLSDRLGLTPGQKAIIAQSAEEFEETGNWATFDSIAYKAAEKNHPSSLNEVFSLPSILGGAWSAEQVTLTALGLVAAGTAPRSVETMARLARICADRKLQLRDRATVGKEVLIEEYGFEEPGARRAERLVSMLPGVSGGGALGDDWSLSIHRGAFAYKEVDGAEDLARTLESLAEEQLSLHRRALAAAPAFAPGGIFHDERAEFVKPRPEDTVPAPDPTAVFVVHGRDNAAKQAMWEFLIDLGLHPLDWEDDLVAHTGQGTPFVGEILDTAFARAQAVVVLLTPDDTVRLHPDLVRPGEHSYETEQSCQPRPNVLFEAGMAFGYCPSRTILVDIGRLRPVTDLGGRHTVRLGTDETLRALARRLETAGCLIDRSGDAWLDVTRFSELDAHRRGN